MVNDYLSVEESRFRISRNFFFVIFTGAYKDPVNNWENLKILIIYLFKKFSMQKFELGSLNLQKAEGLK